MLIVMTSGEDMLPMTKAARKRVWASFKGGGTSHSARACTLGWLLRECERTRTPYILEAVPGEGYYLRPRPRAAS